MGRNVTVREPEYHLPEENEWYPATLVAIEDGPESKYDSATLKWIFEIHDESNDEINGLKVNKLTPAEPTTRNALGKLLKLLLNIADDDALLNLEVDLDDFIGKNYEIMCVHKDTPKGKFANIEKIKPSKSGKKTSAAPPPADDKKKKPAPKPKDDEPETPDIPEDEPQEPAGGDGDMDDLPFRARCNPPGAFFRGELNRA